MDFIYFVKNYCRHNPMDYIYTTNLNFYFLLHFRAVDPLGEIINQEFMDGKLPLQLHRNKCVALIKKILGPYFKNELLNDLHHKDSPYSLYVDDSTNFSKKLTAYSVRYYSHRFKTIKDTFLRLREIIRADARTMMQELVEVNNELNMGNFFFQVDIIHWIISTTNSLFL